MLERREREMRERDLSARIKEEMMRVRPFDPHWLEMQRSVDGIYRPAEIEREIRERCCDTFSFFVAYSIID